MIVFVTVGDSFTFEVTFTGRGGRFGSTFGRFVGMTFYSKTINENNIVITYKKRCLLTGN